MNQNGRRRFLKRALQSSFLFLFPRKILASMHYLSEKDRSLSFYHIHTKESLDICYFKNNTYQEEALQRMSYLLRDHRTGEMKPIDPKLFDALHEIKRRLKTSAPFQIISGFRSPKSNEMLRSMSKESGVAKRSLHMHGQAIDIRLPGCDLKDLYNTCVEARKGGVGYYDQSNFVHVDTGRIRYW